jgi:hypothetical protein
MLTVRSFYKATLPTLNSAYSRPSMRRRYEVWFLRLGLADGSGAWWLRYLLTNLSRGGCPGLSSGSPVQVWATWFPRGGAPQSFIQGFPGDALRFGSRHQPLQLSIGENAIDEGSCRGHLSVDGHDVRWNLRYDSQFHVTLSNKGWIGFSKTPHSDATFAGEITLDGRVFRGDPLGFGVQGHNCGFRHRDFWTWTHAFFHEADGQTATLEALCYEMPLGLVFRKAIVWLRGQAHVFRTLSEDVRNPNEMIWRFSARNRDGVRIDAEVDGRGISVHRLPYTKTDRSGTFEVANNSLAAARVVIQKQTSRTELTTERNAVLEMVGSPK